MLENIFLQISILFVVTAGVAFVIRFLKQPLLVAYIIAGLFAGPMFLNFIQKTDEHYHIFSEIGIVLLLFVVGLSLNFNYIKKVGNVAFFTGVGQVIFTGIVGFLILRLMSFSVSVSGLLALAFTFSSTIIITKLLNDKKDSESVYGRYTIGLMLVQDVIAIIVMIFFATQTDTSQSLSHIFFLLIVKGIGIAIGIYFLSKHVIPFILDHIAKSNEFLFLFTLAWCFGVTSLVYLFGFSLEIGAIIAGLSLGSSPYQPEISSRIRPLRDFFLILFFIILGSTMNLSTLQASFLPGVILSAFILIGNPFILFFLFRIMKFTRRNSFLAGLTAAQVSEFGFVILYAGENLGYVSSQELSLFTVVALITIFFSSYLITYNEQIYRFFIPLFNLFGKDKYQQREDSPPVYDAWVIGYHRMGWKVCETLQNKKISFAVIDFNPEIIKRLHAQKIPAYFGDVADVEFLSELPFSKAKYIISTIPEVDDQFTFIKYVRSLDKKIIIIANLQQFQYLDAFYKAGADYVMMPHFLGGHRISEILRMKNFSRNTLKTLRKEQDQENGLRVKAWSHD